MSDLSSMKKCGNCGGLKKLSEFSKRKNSSDGLQAHCKSCCADYKRIYRKAHIEQIADYHRGWRKANPDYDKAWRKANPETHSERRADYQVNYQRAYQKANPEKSRSKSQRRRARKRGVDLKKFSDIEIFERDNWICGICGQKINRRLKWPHPRSKSLDHIVPLSRGGAHIPQNVQAAHLRCNISKHAGGGGQLRLLG